MRSHLPLLSTSRRTACQNLLRSFVLLGVAPAQQHDVEVGHAGHPQTAQFFMPQHTCATPKTEKAFAELMLNQPNPVCQYLGGWKKAWNAQKTATEEPGPITKTEDVTQEPNTPSYQHAQLTGLSTTCSRVRPTHE